MMLHQEYCNFISPENVPFLKDNKNTIKTQYN